MRKILINKKDFQWYLSCFGILLATDSMLVATNVNRIWARIAWIFLIFFFLYSLLKINFKLYSKSTKILCICIILTTCYIFTMFFCDLNGFVNYFQRIIILWLSFIIVNKYNYKEYMFYMIRIIKFISVFSLFAMLFRNMFSRIQFLPIIETNNYTFKNLIFACVSNETNRNYGIFWEPGAFQLYINLSFLYEVKNSKEITTRDFVIYTLTIFSTYSTSGIIIYMLIVIYYLLLNRRKIGSKYMFRKIVFLLIACITLFLIVTNESINQALFNKVYNYYDNPNINNTSTVSAYTRINSIMACIDIMKSNPLFGIGIKNNAEVFLNKYGLKSNPNTIFGMGSTFGLVSFLTYLYLVMNFSKNAKDILTKVFSLTIVVLMLFTENVSSSLPFFIILFYESEKLYYVH